MPKPRLALWLPLICLLAACAQPAPTRPAASLILPVDPEPGASADAAAAARD